MLIKNNGSFFILIKARIKTNQGENRTVQRIPLAQFCEL